MTCSLSRDLGAGRLIGGLYPSCHQSNYDYEPLGLFPIKRTSMAVSPGTLTGAPSHAGRWLAGSTGKVIRDWITTMGASVYVRRTRTAQYA